MADEEERILPPSIYTELLAQKVRYLDYDIDGRGIGLVWIDFHPEADDNDVAKAEAICQQFGRTLIQPPLRRTAALASIVRLTEIIDTMPTMTTTQRWEAFVDHAKITRGVLRHLLRLAAVAE